MWLRARLKRARGDIIGVETTVLTKPSEHLLLRKADFRSASGATDAIIQFRIVEKAMCMQIY